VRRRVLNALALLALAAAATACRVDVAVDVTMAADGTGTIAITATADAEVVAAAPGLAQDLRFDDVEQAGWVVTGPTVTDDGGITVTITHPFSTPAEATELLGSLNGASGPFQRMSVTRAEDATDVRFELSGVGRVDAGLLAFTDPDLFRIVGATPYVEEIAAANLSPTQAVGITLRVELPGILAESTADPDADDVAWTVPLDGSSVAISATSTLSLEDDAAWSVVATVLLVALVLWVVVSAAFIAFVVRARGRRMRRPRPRPLPSPLGGEEPSRPHVDREGAPR
jgi:hypothetical protein